MENFVAQLLTVVSENSTEPDNFGKVVEELENMFTEKSRLETEVARMNNKIAEMKEDHDQEVYSLTNRLATHECMEKDYIDEITKLQRDLADQANSKSINSSQDEIISYKNEIRDLQATVDQYVDKINTLEHQNSDLEQRLVSSPANISMTHNESFSQVWEEYNALKEKSEKLEKEQVDTAKDLTEITSNYMSLKEKYQKDTSELTQDLQDTKQDLMFNIRVIERERGEKEELQAELENLKMEQSQPSQKGNSLFGEVEDRRVKAETRLVSMQEKYNNMKTALESEKMLRHQLKVQMTSLLTEKNSRLTNEHVDRLNNLLSQLRTDKQQLMDKLQISKKTQKDQEKQIRDLLISMDSDDRLQSSTKFLQALIKSKEAEIDQLRKETNDMAIVVHSRTDKNIEYHRTIVSFESENGELKNTIVKRDMQIAELKLNPSKEDVPSHSSKPIKQSLDKLFNSATTSQTSTECVDLDDTQTSKLNTSNIRPPLQLQHPVKERFKQNSISAKPKKTVSISDSCDVIEYADKKSDDSLNEDKENKTKQDVVYKSVLNDEGTEKEPLRKAGGRRVDGPVIKIGGDNSAQCKQQ